MLYINKQQVPVVAKRGLFMVQFNIVDSLKLNKFMFDIAEKKEGDGTKTHFLVKGIITEIKMDDRHFEATLIDAIGKINLVLADSIFEKHKNIILFSKQYSKRISVTGTLIIPCQGKTRLRVSPDDTICFI